MKGYPHFWGNNLEKSEKRAFLADVIHIRVVENVKKRRFETKHKMLCFVDFCWKTLLNP